MLIDDDDYDHEPLFTTIKCHHQASSLDEFDDQKCSSLGMLLRPPGTVPTVPTVPMAPSAMWTAKFSCLSMCIMQLGNETPDDLLGSAADSCWFMLVHIDVDSC